VDLQNSLRRSYPQALSSACRADELGGNLASGRTTHWSKDSFGKNKKGGRKKSLFFSFFSRVFRRAQMF
jgi:hypothetical protein